MRIAIIAALGLALASCSKGSDSSVCTSIVEPTSPSDPVAMVRQRDTLEWSMGAAERCLHRNAYRLHTSTDEADIVARAVVQACESAVERAVSDRRAQAFQGEPEGTPLAERLKVGDEAEAAARRSWSEFALMKVVEGRAGRCRP
jgi:hypothetical protein